MSKSDPQLIDWVNLPNAVAPTSLWDSVHDGELRSIKSDVLQRSLDLAIDVPHLHPNEELAKASFTFSFEGVQSVRVLRLTVWPGKFEFPSRKDREHYDQRVQEFRRLWRQETESWTAFEAAVNADPEAEIKDGDIVEQQGSVAVRLGVQMVSGEWYESFVRAERLTIRNGDSTILTLDDFLALGRAYWERFAARQNPSA
jgi:hypothetical protein